LSRTGATRSSGSAGRKHATLLLNLFDSFAQDSAVQMSML